MGRAFPGMILLLLYGAQLALAQTVPTAVPPAIERLPPLEPGAPLVLPSADALPDGSIAPDPTSVPLVLPPPSASAVEQVEKPVKLWSGSIRLGLDGSAGNREALNIRFGAEAKRKSKQDELTIDVDYRKYQADADNPVNQMEEAVKFEHSFGETPFTWFARETALYDEAQTYAVRLTGDTGVGYKFIATEATRLIGRVGAGFSHEFGGPEDEIVPEMTFGMEYQHQLSQRQKLNASIDYMPDISDVTNYRFVSKAGWEFLLDEAMNLSLKADVVDRYDSTPHDARPNDIDYSLVLLWKF